jgi:apolipoprotein N-acyltransferase
VAWPWTVLGWIGLVPWLAVLDRARSWRQAVVAGLCMQVAFVLGVFGWFVRAMQAYAESPWPAALLAFVVLAPILEPQLLTAAVARHGMRRAGAGWWRTALVAAGVWVGTEWMAGKLFTDTLGHGLYPSPRLRQAADVVGVHGLTVAVVFVNEAVLAAMRRVARGERRRRTLAPALAAAALVLALVAYGEVRLRQFADAPGGAPVTAGLVQANVSHYDRLAAEIGTFAAVRRILDAHVGLSSAVLARADVDFLLWPETVYPTTFGRPKSEAGADFDREIVGFVDRVGRPLVFGSYDVEDGDEFNAAVVLPPARGGPPAFTTYRKATLFPLTERVPWLLESSLVRGWLPWLGTWKPGTGARVVVLPLADGRRLPVAPLICYDALEPRNALAAVREGATLIVTMSNDSWFDVGPGAWQHLIGAAFRSVETRRAQVRATNTGLSAVITPTGEIVATIGLREQGTLVASVVPDGRTQTVLVRWGEWLPPAALGVAALLALAARPRRRGIAPPNVETDALRAGRRSTISGRVR